MANPIQQGLKQETEKLTDIELRAAMANPIQQGLKQILGGGGFHGHARRNG